MKTLNGYPVAELTTLLDQPLPPQAYKKLPGAANLTDIDAGWQRRAFNKIFGIYGIGWGFDFEKDDIDIRHEESNNGKIVPYAKVYGRFWFAYYDETGRKQCAAFPVTGANNNQTGNEGYTLKGAITNAIGFGASMLGWQESVYLGARNHDNTEGFAEGKGYANLEPVSVQTPVSPPSGVVAKDEGPSKEFDDLGSFEPAKPEPATAPKNLAQSLGFETATDAKPEVKKRAGYCEDCKLVIEEVALPAVCKCGGKSIKECASIEAARKAAASKIDPLIYLACVHCGWGEPVNEMPPACPGCGVVDFATKCAGLAHLKQVTENIKGKQPDKQTAELAAKSKEMQDELKRLTNNDRRLLLQALSDAAGKPIKSYSEAGFEVMALAIKNLSKNPPAPKGPATDNAPAPTNKPLDRRELCQAILDISRANKLGTPRQALAKICEIAGREVNSITAFDEKELETVYLALKGMEQKQ